LSRQRRRARADGAAWRTAEAAGGRTRRVLGRFQVQQNLSHLKVLEQIFSKHLSWRVIETSCQDYICQ
ncbi:mCG146162, partial [Mus musculus]